MGRLEVKESRRTQLIEATIDSLARHGFAEFTLSQVAKAARLSQGIVNFYFRSKEALLIETLKYMAAEYERFWTAALRKAGPRPADKLAAIIAADFDPVMASRKKVTVWYAFWGEARWRPEYLKICQSLSESYFAETRALCQEIVAAGGYKDIDPDWVARGLNAMIDGLWLDILTSPKAIDRKDAKRTCLALLGAVFPQEFAPHLAAARAA
ncbi:MAG TPA: transcriptional regulator BetI [Dongiaceae bacterium]|nr:transcriptional regulator BetI [Dongiaceae bacterium]